MVTKPHVSHERAPLEGHARLVFERLGYSVTYDGEALEAKRDGKVVRVVAVEDGSLPRIDDEADKYCLATRADEAPTLKRTAESLLPSDSDWAVIGLEEDGGYFVA
jgi:hypothetical protein